jgi:perosamine synthetase
MQAALGVAQLESIEERLRRKREIAHRYTELLGDVAGLRLPVEMPWARNVYWMYGLVLDQDLDTDARSLAARLRELGVDTRPFFLGMHEQPVLRARGLFEGETYPVTEELARRGLYLPSGFTLTDAQIEQVSDAVRKAIAR